ncbi:MAG TPA: hypothetical protein VNG12_08355, partial [Acidimicrobiales bacterium]|nr:hypothetical protein [Acidimicrobiales bacterium]
MAEALSPPSSPASKFKTPTTRSVGGDERATTDLLVDAGFEPAIPYFHYIAVYFRIFGRFCRGRGTMSQQAFVYEPATEAFQRDMRTVYRTLRDE